MHKLAVLRQVHTDMHRILSYISETLDNPTAADNLTEHFLQAFRHIQRFPYAAQEYLPIDQTRERYRHLSCRNTTEH